MSSHDVATRVSVRLSSLTTLSVRPWMSNGSGFAAVDSMPQPETFLTLSYTSVAVPLRAAKGWKKWSSGVMG